MVELKPCPFCGGKAMMWLSKHDGKFGRVIECNKCHIRVSFPWASIDAQAIDDWNRRAEPTQEETIERIARFMAKKDWNRRADNG